MTKKEIATQKAPLVASGRNVGAIIPTDVEQVFRLATAIAAANMAPKAYERSADAISVGILHGMEVGLTPMAALQSIAVINGMPTIWGDGALGLVRGSGLLEDFDEHIEGDGDKQRAVCICRRRGQKSEIRREFSVTDAKTAELWGKAVWKKYPKRMLQMRARSWALRDGFADVLRGLGIAEEVRDAVPLYQAADGSYVPEGKPLRAHYSEQAAAKREEGKGAPEAAGEEEESTSDVPDETATAYLLTTYDGEVIEHKQPGQFTDAFLAAIEEAPDPGSLESLQLDHSDALERLKKDGDQGPGWHAELMEAAKARFLELSAPAADKGGRQGEMV